VRNGKQIAVRVLPSGVLDIASAIVSRDRMRINRRRRKKLGMKVVPKKKTRRKN